MDPMDQFVGIVTGSEMTSISCTTQGIADMVVWERPDNESFPTEVSTTYTALNDNSAVSTLSITNINDISIGGMYRCVAPFGDQQVYSSFALLNVTGMWICFMICC